MVEKTMQRTRLFNGKEKRIEILSGGIDEKGAVAYNDGTSGRRVAAFLRK